jgi:hypothetical protein
LAYAAPCGLAGPEAYLACLEGCRAYQTICKAKHLMPGPAIPPAISPCPCSKTCYDKTSASNSLNKQDSCIDCCKNTCPDANNDTGNFGGCNAMCENNFPI